MSNSALNPSTLQQLGKLAGTAASATRKTIRQNSTANKAYRAGVGVVGGATVALGVVLMPLPGPGALIAVGGLGILSTEFESAKKTRIAASGIAKKGAALAKNLRKNFKA